MYVRGHDRDGRPIIFYTPALEKSFNTREVMSIAAHVIEFIASVRSACRRKKPLRLFFGGGRGGGARFEALDLTSMLMSVCGL